LRKNNSDKERARRLLFQDDDCHAGRMPDARYPMPNHTQPAGFWALHLCLDYYSSLNHHHQTPIQITIFSTLKVLNATTY
jgi:hypothetical protein